MVSHRHGTPRMRHGSGGTHSIFWRSEVIDEGVGMEREGQMAGMASPPMNVFEEGDTLIVETALPGLKAEDVEVTLENGKLTIRGETASKEERTERNYILREHRWR